MLKIILFIFIFSGLWTNPDADPPKNILIFGDSITAGYGLDPEVAFPAFIQQKIDERGWNFNVINSGVSGETSAGGLRRVDWVLQRKADVFVLELGGNDGLRGISPELTKENLSRIIKKVRNTYPEVKIVLTGMEAPPNMGESYTSRFRAIFRELAEEHELVFMPFILEDVAGDPELNLPDGIHPTPEGHQIIADNLWKVLEPVLQEIK